MENEKLKRRKVLLSNSIMPWFIGISDDLMFYIAINSLFFTVVKGLSAAEITFLTTISCLAYILLQIPFLKIIQKIGNVKSIRIGTIMLLVSSILMTFGKNYFMIMVGHVLYITSFLFKKMDSVVLENNLSYLNKQDKYIKISSKAKVIYSSITTIIAFAAGGIFAFNHYLPMYLCIGICSLNVLLSFCIFDVKDSMNRSYEIKKKEKLNTSKIMQIIFISFALLYATISVGQDNSKLFIQYNLEKHFEIGLTATYLGIIIVTSRIARIFGNLIFQKIYTKLENKVNLIFPIIAIIAFTCIILGSYLDSIILIKFILMTLGFDMILAIRDPFEVYTSNLLLKNTEPQEQQRAISYMQLSRRIGETVISLIFSMILTKFDLLYVVVCLIVLTIISLGVNNKLYQMIKEK